MLHGMTKSDSTTNTDNAWVVLIMKGDSYVAGALAVGYSLQLVHTKYDTVCMVTPDVKNREPLKAIFTHVIEVPYIEHPTRSLPSLKQRNYYSYWMDISATRWQCLRLTQYKKIVMLDADELFLQNADELFECNTPSSCYSTPWLQPWGTILNLYTQKDGSLQHGTEIPAKKIMQSLTQFATVGAGSAILSPSIERFNKLINILNEKPVYAEGYNSRSGNDEILIAETYARDNISWYHMHQRYTAIPWKKEWSLENGKISIDDIKIYHYFGKKPWYMSVDECPFLIDWWSCVDLLISKYPEFKTIYYSNDQ